MKPQTIKTPTHFFKILVAFDGSKPSMEAVEKAMEIGRKYNSSLIILHVLDSYKYPYLLSSVIFAPTFGSDKFEKEKENFEQLMKSLEEKYILPKNEGKVRDTAVKSEIKKNIDMYELSDSSEVSSSYNRLFETAIVEAETSTASSIVDFAESKKRRLISYW